MTDFLSPLLAALRARPLDSRLHQMEASVWQRIGRNQFQGQSSGWGWRAGLAAAMLAFGAFAGGGATARIDADASPFAIHSAYAPSTLLGSGR